MAWELAAIWIIVAATIVWFLRDVRRESAELMQKQAAAFATSPAWRHQPASERIESAEPDQDLLALHRRFADELRRQKL